MCIRDRNISRAVARESSSFDPESRREGEEVSLREIFRENLDCGRHFSAALDKGDHMAAQGKKYHPLVLVSDSKLKFRSESKVLLIPWETHSSKGLCRNTILNSTSEHLARCCMRNLLFRP